MTRVCANCKQRPPRDPDDPNVVLCQQCRDNYEKQAR